MNRTVRAAGQRWGFLSLRTEPFTILVLGAAVGLAGGGAAIVFHWLIEFCQGLALGEHALPLRVLPDLPWFWVLLIPTAGGLLVGPIVYGWASEARGHGVPEVMEAVQIREGRMRPRIAVAKSVASAITIGSGGSVGREGPVVQIGAAVGSVAGQTLKLSPEQTRTLVGCGAAAGIAATFNAPIAGAFFALEVILGNFAVSTFSPIVLSSVVATTVSRAYFGNFPAFRVPAHHLASWWELIPYFVLGLVCGVIAVAFIRILYGAEDVFERIRIPSVLKPALGGLLLGMLLLVSPHLYGSGFDSIDALLHNQLLWTTAASLVFLKVIACSFTLASGGSGGVFSPSLFLGAAAGSTVGHFVSVYAPHLAALPGAYSLVGMGAVLAGATHAPVASILIIFELTSDYGIILPVMLATTVSTLTARLLFRDSIYTLKLRLKGIRLFGARDDIVMGTYQVKDVMRYQIPTVPEGTQFASVMDRFLSAPIDELFVVDANGRLVGSISLHDVKALVGDDSLKDLVVADDLVTPTVPPVGANETLAECLQTFAETGRAALPVVADAGNMTPIGLITRKDLIDLYDREVLRREMLGTYSLREQAELPPLPVGHRLERVSVPDTWDGQTLRRLDLRRQTGATVLGIIPRDSGGVAVPAEADRRLQPRDQLVVFGSHEAFAAIHRSMEEGVEEEPVGETPPSRP